MDARIDRSWLPLIALSLAVTAWIVFIGEGIDAYYRTRLVDMVHGTAYRPFVYRVLVPGLARIGTLLVPHSLAAALTSAFESWPGRPAGWLPAYAVEYVLVVFLMAVSLVGFAVGIRTLSRSISSAAPVVHTATACIAVAFLPLTFGPFSRQIYDFTTLCLFTWCLVFIAERRWTAFALTFALASVNKESAVLLTLVYAIAVARMESGLSRAAALALGAYQIVVFALVRVAVVYAFRDNPGDTVEVHFFDHNQYVLLHPDQMSKRLLMLAGLVSLGAWQWKAQPPLLRNAFIVLAPALVVMGLTVGVVDEIRAYYEIYPVVMVMAVYSAMRLSGAMS